MGRMSSQGPVIHSPAMVARHPLVLALCLAVVSTLQARPLEIFETAGTVLVNDQPFKEPGALVDGARISVAPGSGALIGVRPSLRLLISGVADPSTPGAVTVVAAPDPATGAPLKLTLTSGEVALAFVPGEGAAPVSLDLGGVAFRFDAGNGFVERSAARTAIGIREGPASREGQGGTAAAPLPAGKTIVWPAGKAAVVTEFTPGRSPHLGLLDPAHRLPLGPVPGSPWCRILAAYHRSPLGPFFESWSTILWSILLLGAFVLAFVAPAFQPGILGAALLLMEVRWDFCHLWWVGSFLHLPVGAFVFGGAMALWIWRARGPWPDGRPPADQLIVDFAWRLAICLIPTLLPLASPANLAETCGKWGGFLADHRVAWILPATIVPVAAKELTTQYLPLEVFALFFLPVLLTAITRPKLTGNECRFCGRGRGMREFDRPLWRNQIDSLRATLPGARLEEILTPITKAAPLPAGQSSPYVLSVTYQLCASCTIGELQLKLKIGTEPPVERSMLVRGRAQFDLVRKL